MNAVDLKTYIIFAKVVESNSFTKAAQSLGLQKSTVSSKIHQLEEQLGEKLLKRSTRSLTLTDAGEGFYRYCEQIVEDSYLAEERVRSFSAEPQGLLRISAPPGIEQILYKDLYSNFAAHYPKIEIEVNVDARITDLVRENFDVALRTSNSGLKDSSLVAKLIMEIEFGFFASPDFIAKNGPCNKVQQLADKAFIHPFSPEDGGGLYAANKEVFSKYRTRLVINDMASCIRATSNGLGISVLPVRSVSTELAEGRLVRLLPDYELPSANLYVVYVSRQWQTTKLKVFLDFIQAWSAGFPQQEAEPALSNS